MLSHEIAKRGARSLPDDTMHFKFDGSAGQSFGAFLAKGVTLELEGDANDYVGKGLSGGKLIVYPPEEATFVPKRTSSSATSCCTAPPAARRSSAAAPPSASASATAAPGRDRGRGRPRLRVHDRRSRRDPGPTGRNFAAGMSGGVAYVLGRRRRFPERCNQEMVELEQLETRRTSPS